MNNSFSIFKYLATLTGTTSICFNTIFAVGVIMIIVVGFILIHDEG